MDELERFGKALKKKRLLAGLSQEELADKCDLDRTYISSIERGKRNLSLRNIYRLASALNIEVSDFFKEEKNAI